MLDQSDTMRVMAERYLRLAKMTEDVSERRKFLDYAALYAELSGKSVRKESSAVPKEKRRIQ
jgi:hypothetical protein